MTRRERLEAKIEKRKEWAQKRRAESARRFAGVQAIADMIPLGQPILVGHHSERMARSHQRKIDNGMRAGIHNDAMAAHHEQKADGLEAQLARNIYSDDDDAPERLRERIAELKATRDRMKASNAAYRKGTAAWAAHLGVSAEQEAALRAKIEADYSWCQQPHPAHELQNLGANIRRLEKRLEDIEARQLRTERAEAAGVLIEGTDYVRVTFPEKPGRDVLDSLRAAGFRWSGGSWYGYRNALPESITALIPQEVNA